MRIKRLEVIGFKSFCDRSVVQFNEPITGVVGPNGCGKSNIVDAIRWCMGEQSAKHLRGKAMDDVIFAGSDSRGPLGMCEVTLVFENDGQVPVEFLAYSEIAVTRKLYRDGTSEYLLNKTPCRLRDITDFFLGTGIGTKAYSIIEQGRIGQIVSSRPQDRRAIIEEAAGITKFKAKKKAAEKKLDQTRQNLMRVSDIVSELDKRMGTLRRQAQKAERYRKYKTELRDIDLWKATHRWLELSAEGKLVAGRLLETKQGLDDARTAWNTKDAHVVAERAELSLEERRLLGVQEQVYELDNRIRLGESKIGFERREADELDQRIASARQEIDEVGAQRERGAAELAARQAELAELAAEVDREAAEVASREAATGEARQQLVNAQGMLDEARAELGARRTEVATSDAQLEALVRRRDEASRRLERVLGETGQHTERQKELEREGRRVDQALVQLRQTRLDLGSQTEGFGARREILAEEVARGEAEVETLRTELHRRRSRLTSLEEIQQRYEGFQRGTRAVMQQASDDRGPWATDAIRGVVADVVRAPEQLEIAVEAALGDRLGGVLVSEPAVGLSAIGFLKQAGGGRSAFVPIETHTAVPQPVAPNPSSRFEGEGGAASWISPAWSGATNETSEAPRHAIEVEDRTELVKAHAAIGGEGVLGRMADLVSFAEGYEAVGKRLLGGTVVVDGLERALRLHEQGVSDRLVTLDGDLVDSDGVVAGGSTDAQGAGVLAQKREIRDLGEIVGTLEHDLSEAMTRLVTAKTELKNIGKALDGLRTQAHEGDMAIVGHEKDDARVRGELDRLRDRLGQLGTEQLELDHRLRAIELDDTVARDKRRHAIDRIASLERIQLDLIADVSGHRERLDELTASLTEARVRAAQLGEKRAAAEASALRLEATDHELVIRAQRLAVEINEAAERTEELRTGCDALEAELASFRTTREQHITELEHGRQAYEARLSALTEVELAARELRSQADRLASELGQLELRNGQIAMTRQNVEDTAAERYQVEVAAILYDFHLRAHVTDVEEARLVELKDLIERMGTDINLTAIEEYAEVSTRFEFLSAQKNDLERAVDQLQRAIDKINKTSRKLFKDTFTAVNTTFKEVFPRLFRGGQAALSLSGGEGVDLLEAGVEIMAQPPGKKNSTVEQLSGGEKALTAVALVFSIFLIKPSPFCILDEVDAPLDEANVDRYNELVREMTDRSQFIVITHNKRTMESADNLYGVTMQEPGVSKLVSVNLSKLGAKSASNAPQHVAV
ncbi:MAG: chromosome segregation protein [Myxococcales bacterium]|nr:chromosome segregation protein [Myxococcales bacterium]